MDERKERANIRKHGIEFSVAAPMFDDSSHIDEWNRTVNGEERRHVIGMAGATLLVLFVVDTERENDEDEEETIRIISARKANRKERSRYSGLH